MQNMFTSVSSEQPRYRSGAVARIAGIPVSTLRIWERRYQVVGPTVTNSGHRLYTGVDIERLLLIKQLIGLGHAVGTLARLPTAALQDIADARAALAAPVAPAPPRPRAALLGLGLPRRLASCALLRVGTWADLAAAEAASPMAAPEALATPAQTEDPALQADLLVAEMATLQPESVERLLRLIQRLGVRHSVVVYGFAAESATQRLRDAGCRLQRAPLDDPELRALVDDALASLLASAEAQAPATSSATTAATVPARRFDAAALAQLAAATSTVECECPRHLAELVTQLGHFETYSAECRQRSPADAALHTDLMQVAGMARAMMEAALIRVAEADAIPLPPPPRAVTV
jgi:DNA-binding transcriptional MerR regulator